MRRTPALVAMAVMLLAGCSGDEPADGVPGDRSDDNVAASPSGPGGATGPVTPSQVPGAGTCLADDPDCADNPGSDPLQPRDGIDVEPVDGLVEVAPVEWERVTFGSNQSIATVTWWSGNQSCYGLDHVEVDMDDDAVTITVFAGIVDPDQVCTMEALLVSTLVDLGEPLRDRSIFDGAA